MNTTTTKLNTPDHQLIKDSFPVMGMSCAGCASSVENILKNTEGVSAANVNFANHSVLIEYSPRLHKTELKEALQDMGFDLIIQQENKEEVQENHQKQQYQTIKIRTIWSSAFTLPIFIIGMFFMEWPLGKWLSLVLTIPVLFWFGRNFFINALKQARHGKATMDTLVALSTSIAFIFSLFNTVYPAFWESQGLKSHVYYEAVTVIISFILLGRLLEEKAKSNTSSAIKKLIGLQPKMLRTIVDGKEVEIPISKVQKGAIIVVKPGEKVPVDGNIISGSSYVDESMITGEPVAVKKLKDDAVFAGTINQKGSFQFRAEKVGEATFLAQIIAAVQEAQGSKAPVQKLVDKVAGIFVPVVISIAILTFISWMLTSGQLTYALLSTVTVLIIACPCALGLATPTAIMVGIGKGAENNMLIKDAESLELGHRVDAVILDKTGTITVGKPVVTNAIWLNHAMRSKYGAVLLALELHSEHPLASAMVAHLQSDYLQANILFDFESITGKGLKAKHVDGDTFYIGNSALLLEENISTSSPLETQAQALRAEAKTVVYFANQKRVLAIFAIQDQVKPTAKSTVDSLYRSNIEVYMLTGDNSKTAQAVAQQVGISSFEAEVLPADKLSFVKQLQDKGKVVAMVGDGINDSQALAQADVSIAMGKGADIAIDVAKITLITSNLWAIPRVLELSRKTVKGIRQNLFWAFIYNLIGIPIAAGLLYPINGFLLDPMIAAAAMAFSSVSVVLNSLRLRNIKLSISKR